MSCGHKVLFRHIAVELLLMLHGQYTAKKKMFSYFYRKEINYHLFRWGWFIKPKSSQSLYLWRYKISLGAINWLTGTRKVKRYYELNATAGNKQDKNYSNKIISTRYWWDMKPGWYMKQAETAFTYYTTQHAVCTTGLAGLRKDLPFATAA